MLEQADQAASFLQRHGVVGVLLLAIVVLCAVVVVLDRRARRAEREYIRLATESVLSTAQLFGEVRAWLREAKR